MKKIALVYDRVNTPYGGAENVLLALHQLYPEAPLFTSVYDPQQAPWANVFNVKTTFLQKIPGAKSHHRWLAPLMPLAFESLDLSEYDVILSVTSAEAKGVITRADQLHICYLLTPPRYLYSHKHSTVNSRFLTKIWPIRWFVQKLLQYLKWWDQVAIHRPDSIIPISQRVAKRVNKYYGIQLKKVIYPPVEVAQTTKNEKRKTKNYFLIVSRLVYYKRIDLAITACLKLNQTLIIVGSGPELSHLKEIIPLKKKDLIIFEQNVTPKKLHTLYNECRAVLMPGIEDFGIVGLEANAHGKPALVNAKSGVAELILHKKHGLHIEKTTVKSLVGMLQTFEKIQFNPQLLIQNSLQYDTNIFMKKYEQSISQIIQESKS